MKTKNIWHKVAFDLKRENKHLTNSPLDPILPAEVAG